MQLRYPFLTSLWSLGFLVLTSALLTPSTHAQSEIHLKISSIPGESTSILHKDEIVLTSFSFGLSNSNSISGGGAGVGKPILSDVFLTKNMDRSSPKLMELVANGKHISSLTITSSAMIDGRIQDFYSIVLEDVYVSSYSSTAVAGSARPTDSLSLNYVKATISYKYYDARGGLRETVTSTISR